MGEREYGKYGRREMRKSKNETRNSGRDGNPRGETEKWGKAWGASRTELRVNGISYGEDCGPERREQGLGTHLFYLHFGYYTVK
jgi:hypothetical protein